MPAAGKLRQGAHHGANLGLLVNSRTAKEVGKGSWVFHRHFLCAVILQTLVHTWPLLLNMLRTPRYGTLEDLLPKHAVSWEVGLGLQSGSSWASNFYFTFESYLQKPHDMWKHRIRERQPCLYYYEMFLLWIILSNHFAWSKRGITIMMMTMVMMIIIQTEANQLPIADWVMSKTLCALRRDAFGLNKEGHSDMCQNMDGPQIRCRIE